MIQTTLNCIRKTYEMIQILPKAHPRIVIPYFSSSLIVQCSHLPVAKKKSPDNIATHYTSGNGGFPQAISFGFILCSPEILSVSRFCHFSVRSATSSSVSDGGEASGKARTPARLAQKQQMLEQRTEEYGVEDEGPVPRIEEGMEMRFAFSDLFSVIPM